MSDTERDPFAGLEDDPMDTPAEARAALLTRVRRGYVRLRKDLVQRSVAPRPSVLSGFVKDRQERALELLLSVHALQPMLVEEPLALQTWARFLDFSSRPCSVRVVSSALSYLEERQLVEVSGTRRAPLIQLLRENGDGSPWADPGADPARGRGFFTVPFEFWTEGHIEKLRLPGKAMLLIILRDTQDPAGSLTFTMPVERADRWYGISERTAERGYLELRRAGLLREKVQKVSDAAHPAGRRSVHHRALAQPFSTDHRDWLSREASKIASTKSAAR